MHQCSVIQYVIAVQFCVLGKGRDQHPMTEDSNATKNEICNEKWWVLQKKWWSIPCQTVSIKQLNLSAFCTSPLNHWRINVWIFTITQCIFSSLIHMFSNRQRLNNAYVTNASHRHKCRRAVAYPSVTLNLGVLVAWCLWSTKLQRDDATASWQWVFPCGAF